MRHVHFVIRLIIFSLVSFWIALNPIFGTFDSVTHWGAIQLFLSGGDPYNFEALREILSDKLRDLPLSQRIGGHPWTLTVMLPFYAWPFPISKFLLAFANLSVYHLCVTRLTRLWRPLPALTPLLMWLYFPLLVTLYFGQFSVFLCLGTVLLLEWLASSNRPWWKWTLAMLLWAIKPQGFIVAAPLLVCEFIRTSSTKDRLRAAGTGLVTALTAMPLLVFLPQWIASNRFSHEHRSATLSCYMRDLGVSLGYDSPLWLWALSLTSIVVLFALRVRITEPLSLLLLLALSQLVAPYLWVYDSCALMPLFYALLGAIMAMPEPRWRRYVGIIFTSVSVFPIYLAIDSDFGFMRLHNVCLAIAAVLLLPGLRKYLEAKT
jgi:hypothetical protein